jgi:hypothetical protein
MEETDLQRYKASWKAEKAFEKGILSETDIQGFLKRKSRETGRLFRKGLIFDMVLKSVIAASFLVLPALFAFSLKVVVIGALMLAGSIAAILYQANILRKIPHTDYASDNLRKVLESRIGFYRKKYIHSLYVGALSNPFLFISGMLFYFYFKYGGIRPFALDDFVVFAVAIIISFVLGSYAQIKQHNFHIHQLEVCLDEIDENTMTALTLKKQRNRRRQLWLMYLLAIISGLLVLAYFLARSS